MQNRGFTLIEVLFTLTIITSLSLISIPIFSSNHQQSMEEKTKVILSSVSEARSYSLIHHQVVYLSFSKKKLHIHSLDKNIDYSITLDDNYYFDDIKEIYYNKNGNINQANHILICNDKSINKIIFNLGSGAYYVE